MMKKLIAAGLMAATTLTAFTPAMAQEHERRWDRRGGDTQAPAAANDDRREGRTGYGGRRQKDEGRPAPQIPVAPRAVAVGEPNPSTPRAQHDRWEERRDGRHDWREDRRDDRHDWRDTRRDDRRDWRNSHDGDRNWSRDWRRDRRYDWYNYRHHYRDHYRIGRYDAPRGWHHGYRRFSVGIHLNGLLFSNRYWIDDPYRYRLPPAYGPLRWVRYYDDVLLIDIRNGYVVDVIHDFFW